MARPAHASFGSWFVAGLVALALGCAAGWYGRYRLIEPEELYSACLGPALPWWCALRQRLIEATFTVTGVYGWVSLAVASAAWLLERWLVAVCVFVALVVGGFGLELYATSTAALGVLLALLRLARLDSVLAEPAQFYR